MPSRPPDIHDAVRSYKKSTAAIVSWLMASSDNQSTPEDPVSLKNLVSAAKRIHGAKTDIPRAIYWAFRDAIENRTKLFLLYKSGLIESDEASTSSHEHFIRILKHIFRILFPKKKRSPEPQCDTPREDTISDNSYSVLSSVAQDDDTEDYSSTTVDLDMEQLICEDEELRYGMRPLQDELEAWLTAIGHLGEDKRGIYIEGGVNNIMYELLNFYGYMVEFDEICAAIMRYRKLCRSGSSNILVAAFLTNLAFEKIKHISTIQGPRTFKYSNHGQFLMRRKAWFSYFTPGNIKVMDYEGAPRGLFRDGPGFIDAWVALQEFQDETAQIPQSSSKVKFEKPLDMIPPASSLLDVKFKPEGHRCILSMLDSIVQVTELHKRMSIMGTELGWDTSEPNVSYGFFLPGSPVQSVYTYGNTLATIH
ncbi:hypothetical protein BU16DRAFT_580822 [Lophium mytilinum]|uniref:DUF6604 domain-containing protein n=1 Tax=Lophium mytilinum TaxID=390894 RepID=A0A6A6QX15_9PEZI|nr:hypothetical protein BU16DRAFT_580822 [Lophium mytilinum]